MYEFLFSWRTVFFFIMTAAWIMLFHVTFCSYYENENGRRFWLPRLTYDEAFSQSATRFCFLCGSLLLIIGAAMEGVHDDTMPTSVAIIVNIVFWFIATWLVTHTFLAISIVIKNLYCWIFRGKLQSAEKAATEN